MKKVKIESMEDVEALPEGEWVEVPEGLHAKFYYKVNKEANKLTITLPRNMAKRLTGKLLATFKGKKIIIEQI
ncbi:MAG: hypothetical protein HY929_03935 [Euryarchaeota archaeon]|nr:hypothetical protein [Euryarchaeota archaeon]